MFGGLCSNSHFYHLDFSLLICILNQTERRALTYIPLCYFNVLMPCESCKSFWTETLWNKDLYKNYVELYLQFKYFPDWKLFNGEWKDNVWKWEELLWGRMRTEQEGGVGGKGGGRETEREVCHV